MNASRHWTSRSTEDFVYRISSDFALQIENKMDKVGITQSGLAGRIGVTPGRVSQVLRDPGNLTLKKMVEYARSLGMKVSVVAYEDDDPDNKNGPINSQIFTACWTKSGKPSDFFSLRESATTIRSVPTFRYIERHRPFGEDQTSDTRLMTNLIWQEAKRTTPNALIAGAK